LTTTITRPLDFRVWGCRKDVLHDRKTDTHENLICRIVVAVTRISDRDTLHLHTRSAVRRSGICIEAVDKYFEYPLQQ
jgi:hypothetical protein